MKQVKVCKMIFHLTTNILPEEFTFLWAILYGLRTTECVMRCNRPAALSALFLHNSALKRTFIFIWILHLAAMLVSIMCQ